MGEVVDALDEFGPPYVVKDDGLAAGKGVLVTDDRDAAIRHAASCRRVIIEEYLDGPEVSLRLATERTWCRSSRRRTSSGSEMVMPAPTPAGWVPTRRCRGLRPG